MGRAGILTVLTVRTILAVSAAQRGLPVAAGASAYAAAVDASRHGTLLG